MNGKHFKTSEESSLGDKGNDQIDGQRFAGMSLGHSQSHHSSGTEIPDNAFNGASHYIDEVNLTDAFDYPYHHISSGRNTARSFRRSKKRPLLAIASFLIVLVVTVGGCGLALFCSAQRVRSDIKSVVAVFDSVGDNNFVNDYSVLVDATLRTSELANDINQELSGPLWSVASFVPVYGEDISAVRTLAAAFDSVATDAFVPMSGQLSSNPMDGLIKEDGAINVRCLQALFGALTKVSPVLRDACLEVNAIGNTHFERLTELVAMTKRVSSSADLLLDSAEQIARLLPGMLGAEGASRNYLIVAENNAEIRTLGGFAGAAGVMTVSEGVISLGEFEGAQIVKDAVLRDRVKITTEEMELFQPYEPTLDYTSGDSYFIPDFPRGSEILATLWSARHNDQRIDGVIAIDPTFLQYVLGFVGGVTAFDGTSVDGDNAARVLLSDTYWSYPEGGKVQDAVFASVADGAFHKLIDNLSDTDLLKLFEVFTRGAREGRLLVWMANSEEEALMATLGMDGALPTEASDPVTGLYVNNYSYSKLDWYLRIDSSVGKRKFNVDGSVTYLVDAALTNTMTAEEEESLPAYVKAHNGGADATSQEMLRLYLYAPMGGSICDVQNSYGAMTEATHNGLQVFYNDIRLKPGESVKVSYRVTVPSAGADRELELRVTPTAQDARKAQMEAKGL